MKKVHYGLLVLAILMVSGVYGQGNGELEQLKSQLEYVKPGISRFLLRGYAHSGFEAYEDESSFVGGSFNPIFLWQQSDRLLFEGELELELENGATNLGLEYANVSYLLSKRVILRAGKFLVPFGIFGERLHPRWINRLPSNPLGFTHHDQVGPISDMGIELRGGAPVGTSKINYSFYLTNGPLLNDGSVEPEEAGMLHYNNFEDNNKNKAVGGRLGILPFSNSAVEVGVSGQYAKVGASESNYEDIFAKLFAVDFSLVKNIVPLKSVVDIKAQYNQVNVDQAKYVDPDNPDETFTFENENKAYFGQFSLKPAFVESAFLQKLEFVGRYSATELAEQAPWGGKTTQWTVGVNFWLDWRTVLKIAYQNTEAEHAEEGGSEEGTPSGNALLIHWSIGF